MHPNSATHVFIRDKKSRKQKHKVIPITDVYYFCCQRARAIGGTMTTMRSKVSREYRSQNELTDSMQHSSTHSSSATQEISRILWNTKVHNRFFQVVHPRCVFNNIKLNYMQVVKHTTNYIRCKGANNRPHVSALLL